MVQASRLLQKTDSGFHKRLKEFVRQRHVQDEVFNLLDLRVYASDESDELEEQGAAMFKFLSVVEFLRQSLSDRVQSVLAEDIFLHEANLWNHLAGPTFRCELPADTQCSDVADDACFSSRVVSWSDCVPRETHCLCNLLIATNIFRPRLIGMVVFIGNLWVCKDNVASPIAIEYFLQSKQMVGCVLI